MVHARCGSRAAILEAFAHEYVKRLEAQLDPMVTREVGAAVKDITASVFGVALQWVLCPEDHELQHEIVGARTRLIRDYGRRTHRRRTPQRTR